MIHKWISCSDLVFIPRCLIMWMQMLQHLKECKIQNAPPQHSSSYTQAVPGRWSWAITKSLDTWESSEARAVVDYAVPETVHKEGTERTSMWEKTCAAPLRDGRTDPGRFREPLPSRAAWAKRTWCGCRSFAACSMRILSEIAAPSFSFILHRVYKSTSTVLRETSDLCMWFFNNSLSNLY